MKYLSWDHVSPNHVLAREELACAARICLLLCFQMRIASMMDNAHAKSAKTTSSFQALLDMPACDDLLDPGEIKPRVQRSAGVPPRGSSALEYREIFSLEPFENAKIPSLFYIFPLVSLISKHTFLGRAVSPARNGCLAS